MNTKEIIQHYTHHITDTSKNEWKVIEVSDIEDILNSYHKEQLKLLNIDIVSKQSELLIAFCKWYNFDIPSYTESPSSIVDRYIESNL